MLNIRPECPGDVILMTNYSGRSVSEAQPFCGHQGAAKAQHVQLKIDAGQKKYCYKDRVALSAASVVSTLPGSLFVQRINPITFFLLSTNPNKLILVSYHGIY